MTDGDKMSAICINGNDSQVDYAEAIWQQTKLGTSAVKVVLGRVFSTCSAIFEDNDVRVKMLKVAQYGITIFYLLRGETTTTSKITEDWAQSFTLIEGLFVFGDISNILDDKFAGHSAWKKMAYIAFAVADAVTGVLWLIAMEVPVLGPYSEVVSVIKVIALVADGAALTAQFSETVHVVTKLPGKTGHKYHLGCLQICERVIGAVSIILGFVGATVAPIAVALGIVAAALGVIRFVYKLNIGHTDTELMVKN